MSVKGQFVDLLKSDSYEKLLNGHDHLFFMESNKTPGSFSARILAIAVGFAPRSEI